MPAVGSEDLYLGAFPAVLEELVPQQLRHDDACFSRQAQRLWAVTGFFELEGHSSGLRLYRVDAADDAFRDRVAVRLESESWARASVHGRDVLRATGLAGNDVRSLVSRAPAGLLELSLQGPDQGDGELAAAAVA
jgi:hypothetical protein